MRNLQYLVAIFVSFAVLSACTRDAPIYNVNSHPVPQPAQALSLTEIKNIIMLAGADRGWVMEEQGQGRLAGTLLVRTHTAKVDVQYSQTEYSIQYKDSDNLRYTGSTIHRNYNKWIMKLEQDIERDLQRKALQRQ